MTVAGDESFDTVVGAAALPVLVDFWATWCGPCRMVSPVVERAAVRYAGRLKVVKVDIDRAPGLARRFGIQSVPTLALFERGRPVQHGRRSGALSEAALGQWLDGLLSG